MHRHLEENGLGRNASDHANAHILYINSMHTYKNAYTLMHISTVCIHTYIHTTAYINSMHTYVHTHYCIYQQYAYIRTYTLMHIPTMLHLFLFTKICEDNTPLNLTLILHSRSTGKCYLIIVRISASVPS